MSKLAHVWYGGSLRARLVTQFIFVPLSPTSARSVANGVSSKSHLPIPSIVPTRWDCRMLSIFLNWICSDKVNERTTFAFAYLTTSLAQRRMFGIECEFAGSIHASSHYFKILKLACLVWWEASASYRPIGIDALPSDLTFQVILG